MRFTAAIIAALVACVSANSVEFINVDKIEKTIVFVPSAASPNASPSLYQKLTLPGNGKATQTFSASWMGNFYSVNKGAVDKPGMLGEVTFGGMNGETFYDVSAIVDPNDLDGIKQLYTADKSDAVSGCSSYETQCKSAYYLPDDVQTQSTPLTDLKCTVGTANGGSAAVKKVRAHARDFINKVRAAI